MRYGPDGLTVIVPESFGSAAIEKFLRDNSGWIAEHDVSLRESAAGRTGQHRSPDEFETLARSVFSRLYHSADSVLKQSVPLPSVRFRQMKTVIANYNARKNEITFSRALTDCEKDVVSMAVSYSVSLLYGEPGSEAFNDTFKKLCPSWRELRSMLPESLKASMRGF